MTLTITLHVTAIWFILSVHRSEDVLVRRPGMTLINISDHDAATGAERQAISEEGTSTPARSGTPDEAEWSITRIKVALPQSQLLLRDPDPSPPSNAPATNPSHQATSNASPGGPSGGAGFDPYAGAAPNWQQSAQPFRAVVPLRTCFPFAPPGIAKQLSKIRGQVQLPAFLAAMPMRVRLSLDESGRVTAVEAPGTITDAPSRDRLIRMFRNKRVRAQVPPDADPGCAFVSF